MEIITYIMAAFAVLGGIDRIIGNKFGLGKEFERGVEILGMLTTAMLGIIILSPVIASCIKPVLGYLPADPSLPMSVIFSIDLGGAHLAEELAANPEIGYFNGIIVATMMGCTISFSIPFALNSVDKKLHKFVFLGFLCGIVTVPIGCFIGGLVVGLPINLILADLLPLVIISAIIAFGLAKFPNASVKVFSVFGTFLKLITAVGLIIGVVTFLTKIDIVPGIKPVDEAVSIIFNAAMFMAGAFPFVYVLSKLLSKPLRAMGKVFRINDTSVTGLLSTLASNTVTFEMMKTMDNKGVVINSAFIVAASSVFSSHMAFAMGFCPSFTPGLIVGKLVGGVLAVVVAMFVYKGIYEKSENNQ